MIYGVLVVTAAKITIDNWDGGGSTSSQAASGNGDQQQQQATSTLFDLPAGRWLVGILGVVLIGAAVYEVYHHTVEASFMKRIAPRGEHTGGAIELFGRIGYAARSVVWAISGIFFIVAAVDYDPNESKGISGAAPGARRPQLGPASSCGPPPSACSSSASSASSNPATASTPDPSVFAADRVVRAAGKPRSRHPGRAPRDVPSDGTDSPSAASCSRRSPMSELTPAALTLAGHPPRRHHRQGS